MNRKLFVTTALPYANGNFHIGHIMEYIQADIWVRFQRMQGNEIHFVCADDCHGAPIMLAAEKQNITPQEFVSNIAAGRVKYLDGFNIKFDHWGSTDHQENHTLAKQIYNDLLNAGMIYVKPIEQYFDASRNMFLPDRYIKGECPKCGKHDQYGDSCESCGAVYSPTELVNPFSVLSGTTPILRTSDHYFFKLSDPKCVEFLKDWSSNRLQPEVKNKLNEWLETGLNDWDISRDAPYFGIEIPNAPGKYFYVWLDAPIGYLSTLKSHFGNIGKDFESFVNDIHTEQYHFIGKDITYFHTLFWPAILKFSGRKSPNNIFVHGFMTVNGEKMSKSRGTGLDPLKYLDANLDPNFLRYYIAAKLNSNVEDVDFNINDFCLRVNSDIVGKYINIASRSVGFITKKFNGITCDTVDVVVISKLTQKKEEICNLYENRDYAKAVRLIMSLADEINAYIETNKPWELSKTNDPSLHQIASTCIEAFRILSIYLKPIIPQMVEKVEQFLNVTTFTFSDVATPLTSHTISRYSHISSRVDSEQVNALFSQS